MNRLDIDEYLRLNGSGLIYWGEGSNPPPPTDDLTYAIQEDSGLYLSDEYGRYILADSN